MPLEVNNRVIALKLIAVLHAQGMVNSHTYSQILKKYGSAQGGTHIELRQPA